MTLFMYLSHHRLLYPPSLKMLTRYKGLGRQEHRMGRRFMSFIFSIVFLWGGHHVIAAEEWAEAPANLTISEFLEMKFNQVMAADESDALNSYSLVSFYPSGNPQTALVFVHQTWHDSRVDERDLRREIRKVGDAYYAQFKALLGHQTVRKRWKMVFPNENFIIKHVRISDLKEVLAVTVDGTTYFDNEAITRSASLVKLRGGVWEF